MYVHEEYHMQGCTLISIINKERLSVFIRKARKRITKSVTSHGLIRSLLPIPSHTETYPICKMGSTLLSSALRSYSSSKPSLGHTNCFQDNYFCPYLLSHIESLISHVAGRSRKPTVDDTYFTNKRR